MVANFDMVNICWKKNVNKCHLLQRKVLVEIVQ